MADPDALTTVLLGQWQQTTRLRAVIEDGLGSIQTDFHQAVRQISRMNSLDDAEGVWLDRIGLRLGLPRPATTDPTIDIRFGFDAAGVGFEQQPFRGVAANDSVYPLPDRLYRRFIRARAVAVVSDGTTASLTRAVRHIDPAAAVQDRRNMTIRIVTTERDLLKLADTCRALPRNAGVAFVYADRGRFGFDAAGVGFDQGPFGTGN